MANANINVVLNPAIDVAKFNTIIANIKSAFDNLKPIDTAKLTQGLANVKPIMVGLASGATSLNDELKKSVASTEKLANTGSLASKAFNFSNMVNSVSIISNAFGQIANAGIQFESNLAAVSAITGFTGSQLDVLGTSARSLAKDFGGSATDQLKSFQGILSKLGPEMAQDSEALALYAKNVNVLSQASGDDAAATMSALTDSLLQMGLASGTPAKIAGESTKAINILAASAQVGAAEIPQVAQALLASGVAAKGANMSLVDVNAAIQVLAVGGKTGAEAGTALRNVLGLMQKASGPAEGAMKKLGTSSADLGKILTTQGLDVALTKIQNGMNKLGSDAEKNATLMEIFGTENSAAAGILLQNADKYQTFKDGIEKGMGGAGAAYEQAAIRMNTAESIISRVQANISDLFISVSQTAGQGITALVGASAQIAPMVASFAGLNQLIPEGMLSNGVAALKNYGATIINFVLPGIVTQDIATKSLVFNTEALTFANIKNRISGLAEVAMNYIRSTSLYQVMTAQMSLNAAMLANPVGIVIIGIVALVGALYLLYTNVESVRNVLNAAWEVIKVGFSLMWQVLKAGFNSLLTVGKLLFSIVVVPFQIWWGVIKAVGNAIGNLIGSSNNASSSFTTMQKIINWLRDAFDFLMQGIQVFQATIEGLIAVVSSVVDSITTGIGQLFSLDFSGLWDTISNAGDKAANAFTEKFNAEMRKADFSDAKDNLKTDLESGLDIKAKIKVETDNQALIAEYEATSQKISELLTIKSSQGLTADQEKQLESLKKKSLETGQQIAKIMPEAVNSMQSVIDENSNITDSYDINITKAKEFASANNYTGIFEEQKNRVNKNLSDMANVYSQQTSQLEVYRKELQKPITNEEDYAKLKDKFKETKAEADKMKDGLIASFIEAGTAGMVTEQSINNVSKALGVSNSQAKEMLLKKELEGAASAGVLTSEKMDVLAKKYNVSKEEVSKIFNKQKEITAETEKTKQATMGWSDILSDVSKNQKEAKEAVLKAQMDFNNGLISEAQLNQTAAESAEKTKKSNLTVMELKKAETDVNKKGLLVEALSYDATEKKTKATKEQSKEVKDQYTILKEKLDLDLKALKSKNEETKLAKEKFNFENDIVLSKQAQSYEKIKQLQLSIKENELDIEHQKQLEKAALAIKDKTKREQELAKAKEATAALNKNISSLETNIAEVKFNIRIDDKKARQEMPSLVANLQTEIDKYNYQFNIISNIELSNNEVAKAQKDLENAKKVLDDLQLQMPATLFTEDADQINELTKKITDAQAKLTKADSDVKNATLDNNYLKELENLNSISDLRERSYQKELIELNKKYNEDLLKAQNNETEKFDLTQKYINAKWELENKKIQESQTLLQKMLNPSQLLSDWKSAFDGVSFFSESNTDNTKVQELDKSMTDLKEQYKTGEIEYTSYIDKLNDLDKNRTQELKKQSGLQANIIKGLSIAITKYTETQIQKYEQERESYVSEQDKRYKSKAKIEKDLSEIEDQNSEQAKTLKRQLAQNEIEMNDARSKADTALYTQMGMNLVNYVAQGKSAFKALVLSSMDLLYGKFMLAIPDIFIQSISWLGPIAGPIVSAGLIATLTGLYQVAKQGVSALAFKDGGLVSGGEQLIRINEIGQEFVVNNKALNKGNNLRDLIAINRDNISIEEYAKRQYHSSISSYNNYLDNKELREGQREIVKAINKSAMQTRRAVELEVNLDSERFIKEVNVKKLQAIRRF